LKSLLVSEVQKADTALAEELASGRVIYLTDSDGMPTLGISLPHSVHAAEFAAVKVSAIGQNQ
jgi:hypothetical protein